MDTENLSDLEYAALLKREMQAVYFRFFSLGVGSRFHSFLEWCGVMGEHLNITTDLLQQGYPAFEMNRHTGETPPIAPYRLSYMTEKMECIFDGMIKVTAATSETAQTEIVMPKGPFTASQIEASITAVTGTPPAPKPNRSTAETIKLVREAALHGWERGRPEDEHTLLLRAALAELNGPPPQTIFQKVPSHWKRQDWKGTTKFFRQDQACVYHANGGWHGYLMGENGIADTITDDREEDQVGDGLGFGERELSFATAEEMIQWIDNGYPVVRAKKQKVAA